MPVLDQDEARAVRGIRDSIAAHSAARELLAETQSEVACLASIARGCKSRAAWMRLKVADMTTRRHRGREDHQRGRGLQHVLAAP
jgi:hypothetical protein